MAPSCDWINHLSLGRIVLSHRPYDWQFSPACETGVENRIIFSLLSSRVDTLGFSELRSLLAFMVEGHHRVYRRNSNRELPAVRR
jgi:hypothetical protein